MSTAIEIRGLTKRYRNFTLGPIDVTVPAGAIYGFVGPNGAGKTTTIDAIMGMAPGAGRITVLGLDHQRDDVAMKRQVGYVSPDLNFQPWGRVASAIKFVSGFYPTWDPAYCTRLLEQFQVGPHEKIRSLSFGARIKLSLVLALSWRPKLLILDEPTVGLDAISKRQLFGELLAAVRDEERTVFISSHAITDLERFADHVGMIRQGQMVVEGAIADVLEWHRIADFTAGDRLDLANQPGVVVQGRDDERWRVLVDTRQVTPEWLTHRGARDLSLAPVTLEELFIALGR